MRPERARPLPTSPGPQAEAAVALAAREDPLACLAPLLATGATRWEALGLLAAAHGEAPCRPLWDRWSQRRTALHVVLGLLEEVAAHAPEAANTWLNAWLAANPTPQGVLHGRLPWVTSLPAQATFHGWLNLSGTRIAALPDGLTVDGVLDLHGLPITRLPSDLVVTGDQVCEGTQLASLPDGFVATGGLDLGSAPIRALPAGLEVAHRLCLRGTQVATLPQGLKVGVLDLQGCSSWDGRIPPDADVGFVVSDRHPSGTPRLSLPEWRSLHPNGEGGL